MDEETILWKLRRRGMEFDDIAVSKRDFHLETSKLMDFLQKQIDRTERGCYDRYNKLRNEGFGGRGH